MIVQRVTVVALFIVIEVQIGITSFDNGCAALILNSLVSTLESQPWIMPWMKTTMANIPLKYLAIDAVFIFVPAFQATERMADLLMF